jgi:hypothetical protein
VCAPVVPCVTVGEETRRVSPRKRTASWARRAGRVACVSARHGRELEACGARRVSPWKEKTWSVSRPAALIALERVRCASWGMRIMAEWVRGLRQCASSARPWRRECALERLEDPSLCTPSWHRVGARVNQESRQCGRRQCAGKRSDGMRRCPMITSSRLGGRMLALILTC